MSSPVIIDVLTKEREIKSKQIEGVSFTLGTPSYTMLMSISQHVQDNNYDSSFCKKMDSVVLHINNLKVRDEELDTIEVKTFTQLVRYAELGALVVEIITAINEVRDTTKKQ